MDLYEAMRTTFAAREFTDDPLPDETLVQILDRARFAPSGGNRQGWRFVVVRDPGRRARLGELYREGWSELVKLPYYASAAKEPTGSPARRMHRRLHHPRARGQADGDHRLLHLSRSPEHHAGGARARHRELPHHHPPVPRGAGEGIARSPAGERRGGLRRRVGPGVLVYFWLFVCSRAALSPWASFTASSVAQKCM